MCKVNSIEHLKELCMENDEPTEFFIALNGGLRSSKRISYDGELFYIYNEIDDTEQEVKPCNLGYTTNILEAIEVGAFYKYD